MKAARNPVRASMPMLPNEEWPCTAEVPPAASVGADDRDGAADHRQCSRAHGDLGDQPDDFLAEVNESMRYPSQRPQVEQHVVADAAQPLHRPLTPRVNRGYVDEDRRGSHRLSRRHPDADGRRPR